MSARRPAPWLVTLALLAWPALGQMSAYGLAAKVNGAGISNEKLERSFDEYLREQGQNIAAIRYPDRVKELRREALDLLIEQELAWQAAQHNGVIASPEEVQGTVEKMQASFPSPEEFVARLKIEGYTEEGYREHMRRLISGKQYLDRIAAKAQVTDQDVQAFYDDNPDKFATPELVRARHILIKVAPSADEDTRRAAREKMDDLLAQARGGADFADLARQHSQDGSAPSGGDLGYFGRGQMVPAFEQATFALQPGEVSDVVETRFGLHIIKLEERKPAGKATLAEAQDQIRVFLRQTKGRQAVDQELERLRIDADIEILLPL